MNVIREEQNMQYTGGKVRDTGAGSCKIYVLSNNGVRATVKVTVIDGPTKISFK